MVSRFAVRLIVQQADKAIAAARGLQPLAACTGYFKTVMGLPCAHDIRALLDDAAAADREPSIPLDRVSAQWRLNAPAIAADPSLANIPPPDNIRDPAPKPLRRRDRGHDTTSRRERCGFDSVEPLVRHCSLCRATNHTARTCPNAATASASTSATVSFSGAAAARRRAQLPSTSSSTSQKRNRLE